MIHKGRLGFEQFGAGEAFEDVAEDVVGVRVERSVDADAHTDRHCGPDTVATHEGCLQRVEPARAVRSGLCAHRSQPLRELVAALVVLQQGKMEHRHSRGGSAERHICLKEKGFAVEVRLRKKRDIQEKLHWSPVLDASGFGRDCNQRSLRLLLLRHAPSAIR